jgi:hypothetical protein
MGNNENCSRSHDGGGFYVVTAYQMNDKEKERLKKRFFLTNLMIMKCF